jgi:hypothetical protein
MREHAKVKQDLNLRVSSRIVSWYHERHKNHEDTTLLCVLCAFVVIIHRNPNR